jgi:hypothetical protein
MIENIMKKIPTKIVLNRGLNKTSDITDYLTKTLNKMGYETENKKSGLSNSEYITIKNVGALFGKDENDDIEIRIADHDLPPSYDNMHKGDFDIMSNNKQRGGTNGDARSYIDFLNIMAEKKNFPLANSKKYEQEQELKKQREENYKKEIAEKKENINNNNSIILNNLQKNNPEVFAKIKEYQSMLEEKSDTPDYLGNYANKYTGEERRKINKKLKDIQKQYGIQNTLWN